MKCSRCGVQTPGVYVGDVCLACHGAVEDGPLVLRTLLEAAEQPAPTKNDRPAVWDLVKADFDARDELGAKRYGTRLQPHNGRDALRDMYEEILDAAVYARQMLYERDGK